MNIPRYSLYGVASLDIKFLRTGQFMFLADEPHDDRFHSKWRYVPVTVTAGAGDDWHHASIDIAKPLPYCDITHFKEPFTVDNLLANIADRCKP